MGGATSGDAHACMAADNVELRLVSMPLLRSSCNSSSVLLDDQWAGASTSVTEQGKTRWRW